MTLTPAQEAIATADCWTDNAVLPTYSQLLEALENVMTWASAGANTGFGKLNGGPADVAKARALLTRHDRTMRGDFKG